MNLSIPLEPEADCQEAEFSLLPAQVEPAPLSPF